MEKKREVIVNILKNNAILIIGVALLLYKSMFLNHLLGLTWNKDVIIYTLVASLFIMCPVVNSKKKYAFIYLNIAYMIATLFIYGNYIYCTYSSNFLSCYQLENIKYAKEIGDGLSCLINVKNLALFWWDEILVLLASILTYKKTNRTSCGNKLIKAIFIVAIIILNIIIVKVKINGIYDFRKYNKALIVQDISVYYYHYEDAKEYFSHVFGQEKVDEERVQAAIEENKASKVKETSYTGIAKDANVIILQMESLNEFMINKQVNGKEIMPNLNKFYHENIYCTNMYNQGLGSTADSEFEMENSLYPLENGYVFQKYYNNHWKDIFSTLKKQGYYTSFMHPNIGTFWNRELVYKSGYGVDEYNDISKFPDIEIAGEFYSDEGFFKGAVNIMEGYDKKFCTTMVSITTHIPFYLTGVSNVDKKTTITQEDVAEYKDETFRNYIISCNFVDYAFGEFIKELKEAGLYENTLLVVYGDHGASLTSTEDVQKFYEANQVEYTTFEDTMKDTHIPFGIKIPNWKKAITIDRAVSKIDIKPTILDLLGVQDDFSIGTSIFTDKDYAFIKGLGFATSKHYWVRGKYYDRNTGKEVEATEELEKLLLKMENEIYLSDAIIKNNLLEE